MALGAWQGQSGLVVPSGPRQLARTVQGLEMAENASVHPLHFLRPSHVIQVELKFTLVAQQDMAECV